MPALHKVPEFKGFFVSLQDLLNAWFQEEREILKTITENYVNEQLQYIHKPVYVSKHIDYFKENNIDQLFSKILRD